MDVKYEDLNQKEQIDVLNNLNLYVIEEESDNTDVNFLRMKALRNTAFEIAKLRYEQQLRLKLKNETEKEKQETEELIVSHIKQKADELRNADSKSENPFFKENTEQLIEETADEFIKQGLIECMCRIHHIGQQCMHGNPMNEMAQFQPQGNEQEQTDFPENAVIEPPVNPDATPEEKEKAKKERDEVIDSFGEENAERIRRELQAVEERGLHPQLVLAPLNNGLLMIGMFIPGANALIGLATLYSTLKILPKWPFVEVKPKPKINLPKKTKTTQKKQEPKEEKKENKLKQQPEPKQPNQPQPNQPQDDLEQRVENYHYCCKRHQCCCKRCCALIERTTYIATQKMFEHKTEKQQQTKITPPSKKDVKTQTSIKTQTTNKQNTATKTATYTNTETQSVVKMAFFKNSENCFVKLNNTEGFNKENIKNDNYVEITEENKEQIIKAITEQSKITEEEATNIVTTLIQEAEENKQKVLSGEQTNFEVTTIITEGVNEQEEKIEKEAKEQNKTQVEHEEENKTEIVSKDENEIKNAPQVQSELDMKSQKTSEQQQNTTVIPPKLNEPNKEPLPNPFAQQDIDQQNLDDTSPEHQQIQRKYPELTNISTEDNITSRVNQSTTIVKKEILVQGRS